MSRKKGLGKGLEALFEDNSSETSAGGTQQVKISEIEPNRGQPRRDFDQGALEQLADSIREHGVIQPLVLRPMPGGGYQIVAGERRYRASRMAGLNEVPAVIRELSDTETMEIALIENLQREDLNPIEEAAGYQELMDKYGFTQDTVAKSVGKSRPAVANALRLLHLPEAVRAYVISGQLSAGHARALLAIEDEALMAQAAQKVIAQGLSVRAVEKLVKSLTAPRPEKEKAKTEDFAPDDTFYMEMKDAIERSLKRPVWITKGEKSSKLIVEFYEKEELLKMAEDLTGDWL